MKINAREIKIDDFRNQLLKRIEELEDHHKNFLFEIRRFLPSGVIDETLSKGDWWQIAQNMIKEEAGKI